MKYAILSAVLFSAGCQSASMLSIDQIRPGMSREEIQARNPLELVSQEGNATTYRTQLAGYTYYPNKFSKLSGIGLPASASWLLTFQDDRLVAYRKDDGYDHQIRMEQQADDLHDSLRKIERNQTDFASPH